MSKQNLYIYIAVLFVIAVILSLIVFALQRKKNTILPTKPVNVNLPTPTTREVRTTVPPSAIPPSATPTLIHPTSTGGLIEKLPKELQDLSDQKQALKAKTPLTNEDFIITFDYGEDKFLVELKQPKTENKTKFEDWLKINYPAIPIDRFIIK